MHRNRQVLLSLAAVVLLLSSACGGGENPAIDTTGTTTPRATPTGTPGDEGEDSGPSLSIDAPQDGATVPGGGVEVRATPSNFQIVSKLGQAAARGEGHVHFYMDVDTVPTEAGKPAVTEQGTYHATATTSYTWPNVTPGEHSFSVQLVNNDHTPLSPPVFRTVKVTVEG